MQLLLCTVLEAGVGAVEICTTTQSAVTSSLGPAFKALQNKSLSHPDSATCLYLLVWLSYTRDMVHRPCVVTVQHQRSQKALASHVQIVIKATGPRS